MERGRSEASPPLAVPELAPRGRWRRLAKYMGFAAAIVVLLLSISAVLVQRRCNRDRAEIAATATFLDRRGQKIRYLLEGEARPGPTVVMLSGFVGPLEQWDEMQQGLKDLAPVLTYDRAGYGLSDPPSASDANAQADELADLATMRSLKLPLVVVGYSSSSLIARAFAKRHAALLGGLVFLDPTNPEQIIGISKQELYARRVLYERKPLVTAAKLLIGLGANVGESSSSTTPAERRAAQILSFPSHWWAAYKEGALIGESSEQANVDWAKVHVPITLLSVAQSDPSAEGQARYRAYLRFVAASGAKFMDLTGYTHDQIRRAEVFLPRLREAIGGVVNEARSHPALPAP